MPPKKSSQKLAEEAIRMIQALNLPPSQESAFPQETLPAEALRLIRKAQYAQKKYEDKGKKDKKYVEKHAVERPARPPNAWVAHVKAYQAEHRGMSYKEAMSRAKETYRKP
jgi:hypothetical protein